MAYRLQMKDVYVCMFYCSMIETRVCKYKFWFPQDGLMQKMLILSRYNNTGSSRILNFTHRIFITLKVCEFSLS